MTSSFNVTRYRLSVLLAACVMAQVPTVAVCGAVDTRPQMPAAPDVLVLVVSGLGPADLVSVNYNSVLAEAEVKRDIAAIGVECGWDAESLKVTSKAAGGSGEKTTSASFQVVSALDYTSGRLPVAAFVQALKRFRTIDLSFVVPDRFVFQGPASYEDRYVKLQWRKSGSAHNYRVVVNDSSFDRLTLNAPAAVPQAADGKAACERPLVKYAIIGLAALCCAVVVFYLGKSMSGARANRNGEQL